MDCRFNVVEPQSMSDPGLSPVQQCPQCTALIEAEATFCRNCGHTVVRDDSIAEESPTGELPREVPEIPPVVPFVDAPVASEALVPATIRRARASHPVARWSMPMLGGAGVLAAVTAMLAFGWLHAQTQDTTDVAPAPAARAAAPAIVEPAPAQQWTGRRKAYWATDGTKTIAFELDANNEVPVWMTRVRPQLVVRCVARTTEVYVSLGSPASLEQEAGSHTVRIQIDSDPAVVQHWTDSDSSKELFAPDGVGLTRRLADAERMTFAFTPFNAPPAVVEFTVQGFNELAPLVASTCGWRLDETQVSQAPRSARLK
jgi:Type VI secretion system VasI, EvfG, VC_A0118